MSKRMALLIGLALAVTPGAGSAQELAASFQVRARPAQPDLIASSAPRANGAVARVPGGWAYSVSRGPGGAASARVTRLPNGAQGPDSLEVAMPVATSDASDQPVTVLFVPL